MVGPVAKIYHRKTLAEVRLTDARLRAGEGSLRAVLEAAEGTATLVQTAVSPPPLTSSPFWILRLELMIILCPLSKVTTSATQLGAQEWLMYLQDTSENSV